MSRPVNAIAVQALLKEGERMFTEAVAKWPQRNAA
jgi:hypothetical protein